MTLIYDFLKQLCQENNEQCEWLLLNYIQKYYGYLKVTVLTDFILCRLQSVVEFLQESNVELCSEVNEISNNVAYLSCIFIFFIENFIVVILVSKAMEYQ